MNVFLRMSRTFQDPRDTLGSGEISAGRNLCHVDEVCMLIQPDIFGVWSTPRTRGT